MNVSHIFQQYSSSNGGEAHSRKPTAFRKSSANFITCIHYASPCLRIVLATSVMIGTKCICNTSYYYTITMTPWVLWLCSLAKRSMSFNNIRIAKIEWDLILVRGLWHSLLFNFFKNNSQSWTICQKGIDDLHKHHITFSMFYSLCWDLRYVSMR